MEKARLMQKINSGYVFMDGGMGTLLQERGLPQSELPESWNLTHPEVITDIHRAYLEAGSDIITTNTFGANLLKFDENTLERIVTAAVENARRACFKEGQFVALDTGPTGRLLEPLGDLSFEEAVGIFAKTITYGTKAGADLIIIETMNDSYEMKAAVLAAKENSTLPIFATCSYDQSGKLMTGATPKAMVALLEGLGVDALGINCSLGPEAMIPVVSELTKYSSLPVIVNPNAGLPTMVDGKSIYDVDAASFAKSMQKIAALGARILGGCCGTTPEYTKAMVSELKGTDPVPLCDKNISMISSYTHATEFGKKPVLIGERLNPTGRKLMESSLIEHNMEYILKEAVSQEEDGADVLDVNVGLPGIDEVAMMEEAVRGIQTVTDLPLEIDSSNPRAIASAMRIYNGKPMVNSVNGKKEVMEEIFPLVKKYGAMVVALLLDEDGIPETARGRLEIARKIYAVASDYGISKKDIILDPVVMAVSTDQCGATVCLETIRLIKKEFGSPVILGVSNVSFGLPKREVLNTTFLLMGMTSGADAVFVNPSSLGLMKAYFGFMALSGVDENFERYIGFATGPKMTDGVTDAPGTQTKDRSRGDLGYAILKGLRDEAAGICRSYLKGGQDPLEIIDKSIIPALNEAGRDFEEKRVFLPQLLMSSEAAKAAFSCIREYMKEAGSPREKRAKFVIATVRGDIHDIGKNIVKTILENYDFEVIDLGKDVAPGQIVEVVTKEHVLIAGLSGLMTTTLPAMEETIRMIKRDAPWCKTIVGGAVLTQKYADMIGADYYAKDAMETVRIAEEIIREGSV